MGQDAKLLAIALAVTSLSLAYSGPAEAAELLSAFRFATLEFGRPRLRIGLRKGQSNRTTPDDK